MSSLKPKPPQRSMIQLRDDGEAYTPVGVTAIAAATEKLLAVNRATAEPDRRDSLAFKRIVTPARMMREHVQADAGKVRRNIARMVARQQSLKALAPGFMDAYVDGLFNGNPLVMPLEEINPMSILEQARRFSHFGPGGIGTPDAVTADMQEVNGDQFGFISPVEGPECFVEGTEVFTKQGWKLWSEVTLADELAGLRDGWLVFEKPQRLIAKHYVGEVVQLEGRSISLAVTPNHRLWTLPLWRKHEGYSMQKAGAIFGKPVVMDTGHRPYLAPAPADFFALPTVERTANNVVNRDVFPMTDWCALFGWYQAEGSFQLRSPGATNNNATRISQCVRANPDCVQEIHTLLRRLNLDYSYSEACREFTIGGKQLATYFSQFGFCDGKMLPEWVFETSVEARHAMLRALLLGDGRMNAKHTTFCSTSKQLADGFERLALSLGYTTRRTIEKDSRPTTKTVNYAVCLLKLRERVFGNRSGRWSKAAYAGKVYCATTDNGFLLTRLGSENCGVWSGNSERAGVDARAANGTKIGSDNKLYQRFRNRKGDYVWLSPEDTQDAVVKLPD